MATATPKQTSTSGCHFTSRCFTRKWEAHHFWIFERFPESSTSDTKTSRGAFQAPFPQRWRLGRKGSCWDSVESGRGPSWISWFTRRMYQCTTSMRDSSYSELHWLCLPWFWVPCTLSLSTCSTHLRVSFVGAHKLIHSYLVTWLVLHAQIYAHFEELESKQSWPVCNVAVKLLHWPFPNPIGTTCPVPSTRWFKCTTSWIAAFFEVWHYGNTICF